MKKTKIVYESTRSYFTSYSTSTPSLLGIFPIYSSLQNSPQGPAPRCFIFPQDLRRGKNVVHDALWLTFNQPPRRLMQNLTLSKVTSWMDWLQGLWDIMIYIYIYPFICLFISLNINMILLFILYINLYIIYHILYITYCILYIIY